MRMPGCALDRALAAFWKAPFALVKNPWLSLAWRKAMRGHRTLRDALEPKVAERRVRGGTDLFSRLCDASRGVDWLDDAGLVRLFIGVMAAAFDTTSLALTSMVYLLAKHPEWQERLRAEAPCARREAAAAACVDRGRCRRNDGGRRGCRMSCRGSEKPPHRAHPMRAARRDRDAVGSPAHGNESHALSGAGPGKHPHRDRR